MGRLQLTRKTAQSLRRPTAPSWNHAGKVNLGEALLCRRRRKHCARTARPSVEC